MPTVVSRRRPSRTVHTVRPNAPREIPKDELIAAINRDILDLAGISELSGVTARSLSIYHNRGSMPTPDIRKGQSPLWHRETIEPWIANRRKIVQTVAK